MNLDYSLPAELIAQHPPAERGDSRLLVVRRASGELIDAAFRDLGGFLAPGDALVLNETRVQPARLLAHRASGGRVELLIVRPEPDGTWRVLARPAKRARLGERLRVDDATELEVVGEGEHGGRVLRVMAGDLGAAMHAHGAIPLPPYIRRAPEPADAERYQTVIARVDGAVAAPTAGLHFTRGQLEDLAAAGHPIVRTLLHVGPGTFRPMTAEDPREHVMDAEWFRLDEAAVATLRAARAGGARIVAVGTTVVRALESACDAHAGALEPTEGWTRKFIHAPYAFQAVDALITNFHLPHTTLLLLVGAFAGEDTLRRAYAHAIAQRYRFYSYGDAMLIL